MSVVILDDSTVREFVADEAVFNKTIDEKFETLDVHNDGILSRCELRKAFESLRLLESHLGVDVKQTPEELNALYNFVFDRFNKDHDDRVNPPEFRSKMKKIMLAIADGLGNAPIQLLVDDDSLLKEVVELESSKSH